MKVAWIPFFMTCMIGFGGCAHMISPVAQQSILNDSSVDQRYKDAIRQGRAIPGMTPKMVEATLGPADLINYLSFDDGSQAEIWIYKSSLAKRVILSRYGISAQNLYITFKEGVTVTILNALPSGSNVLPRSSLHLLPRSDSNALQPNVYGPGIHMNKYGQPVTLVPQGGGARGERLEINPNAYGPGVHMDQYGRPVRERFWP